MRIKASLFINYFVFAILLNSVGTVILQVQKTFNVSEAGASVIEGCKDISIAITSFFIASLIVKMGYKFSMLIALGVTGIFCALMPSLSSFFAIKVLFALVGMSFALIKISVFATISLVTKNEKAHASFMNYLESFFMVGVLTGNFIFSAFVNHQNEVSNSWFRVYYVLSALCGIAFLLLLSSKLDESAIQVAKRSSFKIEFVQMLKLLPSSLVLSFIFSAFFYVLIEQSVMSWLPTFNNKVLHLPTALSIQMASILAIATAVGRLGAGAILQRMHWFVLVISCLLLAGLLVVVTLPLANSLPTTIITGWKNAPFVAFVFPLIGLLLAPIYPAINSAILNALPKTQHAPMSGLIVVFSALGGTSGSLITGQVFQHFGGQVAFYFSLVPIALLGICLFVFKKLQIAIAK